jgi:hypothetical protein
LRKDDVRSDTSSAHSGVVSKLADCKVTHTHQL